MKFTVYTRRDGAYVFVPECMVPPLEAEGTHGRMTVSYVVESDDYPVASLWETILWDIDKFSFAVLQNAVARQLLKLDRDADPAIA